MATCQLVKFSTKNAASESNLHICRVSVAFIAFFSLFFNGKALIRGVSFIVVWWGFFKHS